MKIAILGCGSRLKNVYSKILLKLNHDMLVWNRTSEKAEKFCKENNCHHLKRIEDIKDKKIDLILCLASQKAHFELVKKLHDMSVSSPILLETPAEDIRILNIKMKIGSLEQWPKLPLEQFKELVFSNGLMSRPYFVENDGRSFDYHAIAQLRNYMSLSKPTVATGFLKRFKNSGIKDMDGNLNTKDHEWTFGQFEMENGSIMNYKFSRTCKSLLSIPIQFLRSLSIDGSIVTGRIKEIGNDYEVMDFRLVDKLSKSVEITRPTVNRHNGVTQAIKMAGLNWENPYSKFGFDDQQTAIATLITEALNGKMYPYKESFIDNHCVGMMRRSGNNQQHIKFVI